MTIGRRDETGSGIGSADWEWRLTPGGGLSLTGLGHYAHCAGDSEHLERISFPNGAWLDQCVDCGGVLAVSCSPDDVIPPEA